MHGAKINNILETSKKNTKNLRSLNRFGEKYLFDSLLQRLWAIAACSMSFLLQMVCNILY